MKEKIACWDFDKTLGEFSEIGSGMRYEPETYNKGKCFVHIKNGIKELLEKLGNDGYIHCIVSNAVGDYINESLKRTEMSQYFDFVADREVVSIGGPQEKYYKPIAEKFKVSENDVASNMIVIGDKLRDRPMDLKNLTFVYHDKCYLHDSIVVDQILKELNTAGDGSFYRGFQAFLENSKDATFPKRDKYHMLIGGEYSGNEVMLTSDIRLEIQFLENKIKEMKIPTIRVDDAKKHLHLIEEDSLGIVV